MIDFYHLASEREDPAIVVRAKDHLRHIHMANPRGRVFPQEWGEYDYAPFFAKLREIGYGGGGCGEEDGGGVLSRPPGGDRPPGRPPPAPPESPPAARPPRRREDN